jgi:phosphoglycerate dehydrogenase-like enzyme
LATLAKSFSSATPKHLTMKKHQLYILSEFHPGAVEYAQSRFDCILHTDPEAQHWRQRATAILIKDFDITARDLDEAPQLRAVGKQGVGVDRIDVQACRARGVQVCNAPGVNAGAVAEMALALAMSVARSIPSINRRMVVGGEAIRKETVAGLLLQGKTLGIIGMGNIGVAVAKMFRGAFGCDLIAFDPFAPMSGGPWDEIPHTRALTLDPLLEASDIVTVHVPLSTGTKGLISYAQMQKMKPTAILLNTARGGIVNEDDLARALDENLIYGAGFDCHVQEPPTKEKYERLWSHDRFVGTPHIAAATDETQIATVNYATDRVWEVLNQEDTRHQTQQQVASL